MTPCQSKLTYHVESNRVEYRFRGRLIAGGSAEHTHFAECVREIRRTLPDGESREGFQEALAIWKAREWRAP